MACRFHPLVHVLVTALACVSAFVFRPWYAPAAIAATAAFLLARIAGPARLGAALRALPLFAAVIVLANAFLVPQAGPWRQGALFGLVQSLRVAALLLACNLFLALVDPIDFSDAVVRFLRPLERVGIRSGALALTVMLVMSFAPLIVEEARRLELARAVRCGFPKRGPSAVRAAVPLLAPLIIGVLRRADEVDLALRARGFRLDGRRSTLREERPGAADYGIAAASCIAFCVGLYAQF